MKTEILREFDYLGLHYVETNKGIFELEYEKVVPTKIGEEPQVKVTFRNESGDIMHILDWNSDAYLDTNIIVNTIN